MAVKLKNEHGFTPLIPDAAKPNNLATAGKGSNLSTILAAATKAKGEGLVVIGKDIPDVRRIPTGIFEFDLATGGGIPQGRITMIYGVESSGKTNAALRAIAYVQKHFPKECNKCVFINLEGTFDPKWAVQLGVDVDALIVINPAYGEEAVDMVDATLRGSDVALVVVDSVAVLVSTKEIEQSAEKFDVGTSPILIKRMCNKAVIALAQEGRSGHTPALLLLNQRRFKIGVMFGDPETVPGGEAPKFLCSLILRMRGVNVVDSKVHPDKPVWKETHVQIKKSKIPVTAGEFTYSMAMVPLPEYSCDVGETKSFTKVCNRLREIEVITKPGSHYVLYGESYKTLALIEERYLCDDTLRAAMQQDVIKSYMGQTFIVAEKQEAAPPVEGLLGAK